MKQSHSAVISRVDVHEALKATSSGAGVLIDVRELDETAVIAAAGARLFPMSEIQPETFEEESGIAKATHLYILCRSGGRSFKVASALLREGFQNLYNVEGGIIAWRDAGLPIIQSP